eukprot:gene29209-35260_t
MDDLLRNCVLHLHGDFADACRPGHESTQPLFISHTLLASLDDLLESIDELAGDADRRQDGVLLGQCIVEQICRAWQLCEAVFLAKGPVGYEIIPWIKGKTSHEQQVREVSSATSDADFWSLCCQLALCGDLMLLGQLLAQHGSLFIFPAFSPRPDEIRGFIDILLAHPYVQHTRQPRGPAPIPAALHDWQRRLRAFSELPALRGAAPPLHGLLLLLRGDESTLRLLCSNCQPDVGSDVWRLELTARLLYVHPLCALSPSALAQLLRQHVDQHGRTGTATSSLEDCLQLLQGDASSLLRELYDQCLQTNGLSQALSYSALLFLCALLPLEEVHLPLLPPAPASVPEAPAAHLSLFDRAVYSLCLLMGQLRLPCQLLSRTLMMGRALGRERVLHVLRSLHSFDNGSLLRQTDDEVFAVFDQYVACGCAEEGRQMLRNRGLALMAQSTGSCCGLVYGLHHRQLNEAAFSSSSSSSLLSRSLCFLQLGQHVADVQKLLDCVWFDLALAVVRCAQVNNIAGDAVDSYRAAAGGAAAARKAGVEEVACIQFAQSLQGQFSLPPLPPLPSLEGLDADGDVYHIYKQLAKTLLLRENKNNNDGVRDLLEGLRHGLQVAGHVLSVCQTAASATQKISTSFVYLGLCAYTEVIHLLLSLWTSGDDEGGDRVFATAAQLSAKLCTHEGDGGDAVARYRLHLLEMCVFIHHQHALYTLRTNAAAVFLRTNQVPVARRLSDSHGKVYVVYQAWEVRMLTDTLDMHVRQGFARYLQMLLYGDGAEDIDIWEQQQEGVGAELERQGGVVAASVGRLRTHLAGLYTLCGQSEDHKRKIVGGWGREQ